MYRLQVDLYRMYREEHLDELKVEIETSNKVWCCEWPSVALTLNYKPNPLQPLPSCCFPGFGCASTACDI